MRVPGIFQATWAVAKTFFDPNTAKKIFFVGSGAEAEKVAISERGAWGVWPACYGGPNQEPVPCPNVFIVRWRILVAFYLWRMRPCSQVEIIVYCERFLSRYH